MTPAIVVVLTAPRPTSSTPSLPRAGAIWSGAVTIGHYIMRKIDVFSTQVEPRAVAGGDERRAHGRARAADRDRRSIAGRRDRGEGGIERPCRVRGRRRGQGGACAQRRRRRQASWSTCTSRRSTRCRSPDDAFDVVVVHAGDGSLPALDERGGRAAAARESSRAAHAAAASSSSRAVRAVSPAMLRSARADSLDAAADAWRAHAPPGSAPPARSPNAKATASPKASSKNGVGGHLTRTLARRPIARVSEQLTSDPIFRPEFARKTQARHLPRCLSDACPKFFPNKYLRWLSLRAPPACRGATSRRASRQAKFGRFPAPRSSRRPRRFAAGRLLRAAAASRRAAGHSRSSRSTAAAGRPPSSGAAGCRRSCRRRFTPHSSPLRSGSPPAPTPRLSVDTPAEPARLVFIMSPGIGGGGGGGGLQNPLPPPKVKRIGLERATCLGARK